MAHRYTRNMIRSVFMDMLEERPLDEITVTDLVNRCEINRKTFYYYYSDLYAVISELFEEEVERAAKAVGEGESWEKGFLTAVEIAEVHRRAIYHIYHSMSREELERYLSTIAGKIMERYVERESKDIAAHPADKRIITMFYQSALTQIVLSWIADGMRQDARDLIDRMGMLFDGNIALSLKRSEALPPPPPQRKEPDR